MNPEDIQKIVDYLTKLVSPTVAEGWQLAYKQVLFMRIWDIVWIFICITMIILITRGTKWVVNYDKNSDYPTELPELFYGLNFFSIIPSLIILANLYEIINFLINPNWVVLSFLLNTIKNLPK
jgi:hypothetical protein